MKKEYTVTFRRPKLTVALVKTIAKSALYLTAIVLVILLGFKIYNYDRPYDDSDWPELELRSGLTVYVDYGTGCHWLRGSIFGTLVPRLNGLGNQVCIRGDARPRQNDRRT